jgi:hypothetical protein
MCWDDGHIMRNKSTDVASKVHWASIGLQGVTCQKVLLLPISSLYKDDLSISGYIPESK